VLAGHTDRVLVECWLSTLKGTKCWLNVDQVQVTSKALLAMRFNGGAEYICHGPGGGRALTEGLAAEGVQRAGHPQQEVQHQVEVLQRHTHSRSYASGGPEGALLLQVPLRLWRTVSGERCCPLP
jgi:hypothetical protein